LRDGKALTPFGEIDAKSASGPDGTNVMIAIRLGDLEVKPWRKPAKGLTGHLVSRRFIGTSELLELRVEGQIGPLRARINAGELPGNTRKVKLSVRNNNLMVFPAE